MAAVSIVQTDGFQDWLHRLRDERAKARIAARIQRMTGGNPGDTRQLGGGLMEMRIDVGPSYHLCLLRRGISITVLLCGGDKRSQERDIAKARQLIEEFNE